MTPPEEKTVPGAASSPGEAAMPISGEPEVPISGEPEVPISGAAPLPPPDIPTATPRPGDDVIFPGRDRYHDVVSAYRDGGYELLSDLCAADYLTHPGRNLPEGVKPERFEVVASLTSVAEARRVRVRVQVPEDDPSLPTLWDLYPGAEAMEREAFDMFGVHFEGHPDLTRILMPEDWEGHPLRKDYAVGRVPVQFKEAPGPR